MFFLAFKIGVAVAAAFLHLPVGHLRGALVHPRPPGRARDRPLRKVDYRYRCTVCGTEVTMTAAPEDEIPNAPRHCREDMNLVVESGEW